MIHRLLSNEKCGKLDSEVGYDYLFYNSIMYWLLDCKINEQILELMSKYLF